MAEHVRSAATELGPLVMQLTAVDAAAAVRYYCGVLEADELYRNIEPGSGRIVHCELLIAGVRIVVHDEFPELDLLSPTTIGGSSVSINLYMDDVDAVFELAIKAGGKSISPPQDRFWGARSGSFLDPFGHRWIISTQIRDPSPDEIIALSRDVPIHMRMSAARRSE